MTAEQVTLLWVEYKHLVPWLYAGFAAIAVASLLINVFDPAPEPQSRFESALVRGAEAIGPFFIVLLILCALSAYLMWEFPPSN